MEDPGRLLSVVIPVYNERTTVATVLERVIAQNAGVPKEIVVVDDASTDGT
ncbi:glycosyltransferase, partial [Candidatus Fermentibacteria bacterium]|nr:glycosyltransferase [Candidatus Fermentibacteria bacterium]